MPSQLDNVNETLMSTHLVVVLFVDGVKRLHCKCCRVVTAIVGQEQVIDCEPLPRVSRISPIEFDRTYE